jgi:hypothetical protein
LSDANAQTHYRIAMNARHALDGAMKEPSASAAITAICRSFGSTFDIWASMQ